MKKISTILIVLIILCSCIMPSQAVYAPINVGIVDYTINYMGTEINSELNYPLISYDNTTYMAIRDVAHLWNREVLWDVETQTIDIIDEYSDADGYGVSLMKSIYIWKDIQLEYYGR